MGTIERAAISRGFIVEARRLIEAGNLDDTPYRELLVEAADAMKADPKLRRALEAFRPPPEPAWRDGIAHDVGFGSAKNFAERMSPTAGGWDGHPERWIFRGQVNADWSLRASAVRSSDPFKAYGIRISASPKQAPWSARKERQLRLLEAFRRRLDDSGVVIPSGSPGTEKIQTYSGAEPDPALWPLMALAQHHGLPTMLLDWSRRARVAAYFAAADVVAKGAKGELTGTHLAVWALRIPEDEEPWTAPSKPRPDGAKEFDSLRVYQAPGGTNPNLRAQSGVFTLMSSTSDASIEQHLAAWRRLDTKRISPLLRFTLPHHQARQLLQLLSHEGVDGASLFPGADGCVRAMGELGLWNNRKATPTMNVRRPRKGTP